jgi:hypothetical protein
MSESSEFQQLANKTGLELPSGARLVFHLGLFLVCFLLLYSRRPDAIGNAQFYAEDGAVWYRDAYQLGWRCLLIPETGYLQTVSRLIAMLALLLPFAVAPLAMNLGALAIHILPVNLFLSRRFDGVPLLVRLLASLVYLGIPNSLEIHGNTTNIQWHLGLACLLMILGRPPEGKFWIGVDVCALALLAFDSPLGFLLVPIAAVLWRKERGTVRAAHLAALLPGTLVQTLVLFFLASARAGELRGGSQRGPAYGHSRRPDFPFRSGGGQDAGCSLPVGRPARAVFGADRGDHTRAGDGAGQFARSAIPGQAVSAVCGRGDGSGAQPADRRPRPELPAVGIPATPGAEQPLLFFPILAFYAALFSLVLTGKKGAGRGFRYAALAILLAVPFGVWRDWKYPQYPDLHFAEYAREFERAKPGSLFTIPIVPTGWQMRIVKR